MQSVLVVAVTLSSHDEQQQPYHKPPALVQSLIPIPQRNAPHHHPSIHPSTDHATIPRALRDLLARLAAMRLGPTTMRVEVTAEATSGDEGMGGAPMTQTAGEEVRGWGRQLLMRPSIPRSMSAMEPAKKVHLGLPAPALGRGLSSIHVTADHRPPPFLMHHARSKSAQPALACISPSPAAVSRPQPGVAEALLHRALEEDCDARQWADDQLDPPHLSDLPVSHPLPIPPFPSSPKPVSHMDPLLAELEAKSRLNVQTECAICQKKGINFPKCPKCQLEFCSRACRVSMGDGERHKCA